MLLRILSVFWQRSHPERTNEGAIVETGGLLQRHENLLHLYRAATSTADEPDLELFSVVSRVEMWSALHQSVVVKACPLTTIRFGCLISNVPTTNAEDVLLASATSKSTKQKESDRDMYDRHASTHKRFKCYFCAFQTKRETNCNQDMERKHAWTYLRTRVGQKASRIVVCKDKHQKDSLRTAVAFQVYEFGMSSFTRRSRRYSI